MTCSVRSRRRSFARRLVTLALLAGAPALAQSPADPAAPDTIAGVTWLRVPVPGGRNLVAAVARPPGEGPYPVVVVLHGSHGFGREYVRLARDLARDAGVVAVAGCWFAGGAEAGRRFVARIACPEAPPMSVATNADARWADARAGVDALVEAARALPGVRRDRVALVGHSRGAGTALQYAHALAHERGIRAVALNSAGYPDDVVARAPSLGVPVLVIHGTADALVDGGSAFTAIARARAFEAALRAGGRDVEAMFIEGGGHNGLFASAAQYDASVARIASYLRRTLAP
jgi:dienelactone hydrolase